MATEPETAVLEQPPPDTTAQEDAPTPPPPVEPEARLEVPGTEQEAETAPAPEEEPEKAEGADVTAELDEETLEAIAEVYRDRLLSSKALGDQVQQAVRKEVERQVTQTTRVQDAGSRSELLINQGKAAARAVAEIAESAQRELGKAAKGEDFKSELVKPEELVGHLGKYGTAVSAYVSDQFDVAVESAWDAVFSDDGLPPLSEEQAGELAGMIEIFHRMEGDPRQATQSKPYFFANLFRFIAARGLECGATQERTRSEKAKTIGEKIVDKNAIAAAKAKIEKERTPPTAPKSRPRAPTGGATDAAYQEAKKAGDHDRAQSIVDQMAAAAGAPR